MPMRILEDRDSCLLQLPLNLKYQAQEYLYAHLQE